MRYVTETPAKNIITRMNAHKLSPSSYGKKTGRNRMTTQQASAMEGV